jgi:hypothetical protein
MHEGRVSSNDDRYSGLKGLRTVIFINEHDMNVSYYP